MLAHLTYDAILDRIHQYLYPRTYLEIGIRNGDSLALALPGTRCIGVDPDPQIVMPLPEDSTIESSTSDAFFETDRAARLLADATIDLAFIDGMHLFEYALRDFMNIERLAASNSVVLLHDVLPRSASEAQREPRSGYWAGDVWKVLYCLREERPDLSISVIDAFPTGLAIVQKLNPTHPRPDVDRMVARYRYLDFDVFRNDLRPSMTLIPNDWRHIRAILPSQPWQSCTSRSGMLRQRRRRPVPPLGRRRVTKSRLFRLPIVATLLHYKRTLEPRGAVELRSEH